VQAAGSVGASAALAPWRIWARNDASRLAAGCDVRPSGGGGSSPVAGGQRAAMRRHRAGNGDAARGTGVRLRASGTEDKAGLGVSARQIRIHVRIQ